ncbi:MAG: hypothetical protein MUF75_05985 [Bacteroidia bacterium]|jgi:hypothetical protein|nr:hypothetical protein [Bacteroidia bacterium]
MKKVLLIAAFAGLMASSAFASTYGEDKGKKKKECTKSETKACAGEKKEGCAKDEKSCCKKKAEASTANTDTKKETK